MENEKRETLLQVIRKKISNIRTQIKKYRTYKKEYPQCYLEAAKEPVQEDKIVFIEIRLPELTNSFQTIYRELSRYYKFDIHCHFLRTSFVSKEEHKRRCLDMIKDVATAKYVFMDEASIVFGSLPIREETIVTQLWHGCGAFKKFGMSTADLIFGSTRKDMIRYPINKNYTHVTVSSPEVIWAYEEAMNIEKDSGIIKALGSSRTDVFYDDMFIRRAYQKLHRLMPEAKDKKVILYAPTFRGRVKNAMTPTCFDIEMFANNLSEDYVLLVKHHPLVRVRPEIPEQCRSFARDFTDTMAIDELLCVSDICISDYSSLVFEYSLFEKPMIFYAYDLDEYFDWRGFYYDYYELAPGPIVTTNEEMIEYIKNIDTQFDKQRVTAFKEKFMSACDGHATQRILQTVMGEEVLKSHTYRFEQFKDNIKVSVIVPVYNCGNYLIECMDSIVSQRLREIEIICVNDGSTDDSLEILQYYASKDDRIRIITQDNQYAGVARNAGMQHAHGEYLMFWDGDDFFKSSALKRLYGQAQKEDADICVCGAQRYDEEAGEILHTNVYLKTKYLPEKAVFSKEDMQKYIFNFATNVPWNKMFKRSFVEKNHLRFQELKQANDTYFVMMALFLAERITTVDRKPIYYRFNNANSLTGKASDTVLCVYESYVKVYDELEKSKNFTEEIRQSFANRALSGLLGAMGAQRNLNGYREIFNKIKSEGLDYFGITGHERDYYYVDWQYRDLLNIEEMNADEFLYSQFRRERLNVQKRKTQITVLNKEMETLSELAEQRRRSVLKLKKKMNSRTVRTAYKLKKIVTLNGLLVRKKSKRRC